MTFPTDADWGALSPEAWASVPHISGRLATERDVAAGHAVFYLNNTDEMPARPGDINLPALAVLRSEGPEPECVVVVIQIELGEAQDFAGVRFFDGGNGVCALGELMFISESDSRFVGLLAGWQSGAG